MPKTRFTADLDQELYQWVMQKAHQTGKSRNWVLGEAVKTYKKQEETKKLEDSKNE